LGRIRPIVATAVVATAVEVGEVGVVGVVIADDELAQVLAVGFLAVRFLGMGVRVVGGADDAVEMTDMKPPGARSGALAASPGAAATPNVVHTAENAATMVR
jgi:hypothetical protein